MEFIKIEPERKYALIGKMLDIYWDHDKSEELDFSIGIRLKNLIDEELEFIKQGLLLNIEGIKISIQKESDMILFHIKHYI